MNKKAFTLIELLVVVLIIGILAAVALPQYQTAVNKSRYAGLMPLAKSVKDAEEAQLMATGKYTDQLGDLAVQVPGAAAEDGKSVTSEKGVTVQVVSDKNTGQDYVKAVDGKNEANTYVMYFAKSPRYGGEIHCEALTTNEKAQQLCKSYGPIGTVNGTNNKYTAYVLQGNGISEDPLPKALSGSTEPTTCSSEPLDEDGDYMLTQCNGGRRDYDDGSYVEYNISCYAASCSETSENPNYFQWTIHTADGETLSFAESGGFEWETPRISMGEEYSSVLGQTATLTWFFGETPYPIAIWKVDDDNFIQIEDSGGWAEIVKDGVDSMWWGDGCYPACSATTLAEFVGTDIATSYADNPYQTGQDFLCHYDPANPRCS